MKTFFKMGVIALCATFVLSCEQKAAETPKTVDLINDNFPEKQKEVSQVMDDIAESIAENDMDRLISFHVYGPKFTEFKNGEKRAGSKENEEFERGFFGSFTGVHSWETDDMKVAVFDKVANVTFHANFRPIIAPDTLHITGQVSLLFVETPQGWKITHEHFSPLTH